MNREALIGLGSNLGEREQYILQAAGLIEKQIGRVLKQSKIIETPALVLPEFLNEATPSYLNAALLVSTALGAELILKELLAIEQALGRDRLKEKHRWMSRVIDLDLLAVENAVLNTKDLTLPHPELTKRLFVLQPLNEIASDWIHPVEQKSIHELYELFLKSSNRSATDKN